MVSDGVVTESVCFQWALNPLGCNERDCVTQC
uniref:ZP domain-containing protein n=1 Tax=Anguilla anguilla TaxID=7936 RepID=A0A0E9SDG6_ANGAN